MNESRPKKELMDIHGIILDNVAFNISGILNQHNYGTIKIDEPKAESLHVLQFTPIPYTQYRIQ